MSDFRLPFQKRLCEEVALGLEGTERGGNSVGIILRGGSGRGKTHAIDLAIRSLPPRHRVGAQVITPCIRLDASALSGGNALQAACLAQLGMGPESPRSRNPGEMERRLYGALLTHRVQASFVPAECQQSVISLVIWGGPPPGLRARRVDDGILKVEGLTQGTRNQNQATAPNLCPGHLTHFPFAQTLCLGQAC